MVDEWLASYGLYEEDFIRSPALDWVKVKVPIGLAEKMLDTVSFCLFSKYLQSFMRHHCLPEISRLVARER